MTIARRLDTLEKRLGGDDEGRVVFVLHPNADCPEIGTDGRCRCQATYTGPARLPNGMPAWFTLQFDTQLSEDGDHT